MKHKFRQSSGIAMRATAIAIILLLFSLYQLFIEQYIIGLFFIALATPLLFIQRYCEINTNSKTLFKYLSVFGIPLGKRVQMQKPRGIKIVKAKTSRVVNSRVQTTNLSDVEFQAIIFFDDKNIQVASSTEKSDLLQKMTPIVEELQIPLKS